MSRGELETRFQEELEARKVLEAKLQERDEAMAARTDESAAIADLRKALKETQDLLGKERAAREELQLEIARLNKQAESVALEAGPELDLPTLRMELAKLKQKLSAKLQTGEIQAEEIMSLMGVDGVFGFYIVRPGDSLWKIAEKKEVYGDPFKWPLLYRYNLTKIDEPDTIEPDQILLIYNKVSEEEARDAVRKAMTRGDWKTWTDREKKSWLDDWMR